MRTDPIDPIAMIGGQTFHLLHERAAFWEERATLLVADPHWGKAATFRSAGLFVPRGTTGSGVARLESILSRMPARRIIFLGDFLHAREGRARRTFDKLADWRSRRPELELVLVRGNHDRGAGDPPAELDIWCLNGPLLEDGLAFTHFPDPIDGAFVIAGHLHPGVRLVGRGRQRQRLPCFWLRHDRCVLPAFGDFTGMAIVEPTMGDRVFVVADTAVVEIGGRPA